MSWTLRLATSLVALWLLPACGGHSTVVVRRDGPPFASVYASVDALLARADTESARQELMTLQLPDTREHHDALLAALRESEGLDVDDLRLLLGAVHFEDAIGGTTSVTINGETTVTRIHARNQGRWAPVADTLLEEGLARLEGLDLAEFAALAGHAESDATLERIWDAYGAPLDDGSARTIHVLADRMEQSPTLSALFVQVLLPRGELAGERGEVALGALSFDSERLALSRALLAERESVDVDTLLDWCDLLSFDSSRLILLDDGVARLEEVDGGDLERLLDQLSFDSSRQGLMQSLVEADRVRLAADDLQDRLEAFSFDSTRADVLRMLLPQLTGPLSVDQVGGVLETLSFDSTRLDALRALRDHMQRPNEREVDDLLELLSFDSSREDARRVLEGVEEPR